MIDHQQCKGCIHASWAFSKEEGPGKGKFYCCNYILHSGEKKVVEEGKCLSKDTDKTHKKKTWLISLED